MGRGGEGGREGERKMEEGKTYQIREQELCKISANVANASTKPQNVVPNVRASSERRC